MARVLFAALANHGHVYPLMPLALACRDAGDEVVFATGAEFHGMIGPLGLGVRPVGESIGWGWREALRRHPELPPTNEREIAPRAAEILAQRVLEELLPILHAERPDLVVYEPYCPAAALAARLLGIPAAAYIQGRALPKVQAEAIGPRLAQLWQRYGGVAPPPRWTDDLFLDSWPATLQRTPSVVDLPKRHPIRPVPWHDPASQVPEWATGPRPRPLAYLALSTVFALDDDALSAAVRGLLTLDLDVLAVVGARDDLDALRGMSDRIRVERFVAQAAVLPYADVVVSHGGSGTLLGALAAGLPQLVLPYGADQFTNGEDIERVGGGRCMAPADATAEAVARTVSELLEVASYRAVAAGIGAEIAEMPAPEALVPVLHGLAGQATGHTMTSAGRS
jgi:UDP:flavonoid glycosyltransferase YjiC (YdhE family)